MAYIESGEFYYEAKARSPITKGSCAPLFGKYYTVTDVQAAGMKSITFDTNAVCSTPRVVDENRTG